MTILDTTRSETIENATQAGWFDDPQALHAKRYFDGSVWTDHVTHYGPAPCEGCGALR